MYKPINTNFLAIQNNRIWKSKQTYKKIGLFKVQYLKVKCT